MKNLFKFVHGKAIGVMRANEQIFFVGVKQ